MDIRKPVKQDHVYLLYTVQYKNTPDENGCLDLIDAPHLEGIYDSYENAKLDAQMEERCNNPDQERGYKVTAWIFRRSVH